MQKWAKQEEVFVARLPKFEVSYETKEGQKLAPKLYGTVSHLQNYCLTLQTNLESIGSFKLDLLNLIVSLCDEISKIKNFTGDIAINNVYDLPEYSFEVFKETVKSSYSSFKKEKYYVFVAQHGFNRHMLENQKELHFINDLEYELDSIVIDNRANYLLYKDKYENLLNFYKFYNSFAVSFRKTIFTIKQKYYSLVSKFKTERKRKVYFRKLSKTVSSVFYTSLTLFDFLNTNLFDDKLVKKKLKRKLF